jgi:hypothetical protein
MDSLDALAWCVWKSRAPLPVRMTIMAILAGAVAQMGDDYGAPVQFASNR